MQDYISDGKNKEGVDKIKLALLSLDMLDFAEGPIEISTSEYLEPFPGQDYTVWGCLDWTQIHQTSKQKKPSTLL
jgi:hypothetical protein